MIRRFELLCIIAAAVVVLLIPREALPSWRVSREIEAQNRRLEALQGNLEKTAADGARHESELAAHAKKLAEHDAAIARNAEALQGVRDEIKRLEERTAKDVGELRELYKKSQRDTELLTEEVLQLKQARRRIENLLDTLEKRLDAARINPGEIQ